MELDETTFEVLDPQMLSSLDFSLLLTAGPCSNIRNQLLGSSAVVI